MTRYGLLFIGLALAVGVGTAQAQMKLGYIDSQKIMEQYKPYQDAQKEYDQFQESLSREVSQRQNELAKMQDDYKRQELLLSDKRKQEEQQNILKKQQELQTFVQEASDPDHGKLAQKTSELLDPIVKKVNEVIKQVAEDNGYDFVLNTAALAYAKDTHDLTDKVLEALQKDLEAAQKAAPKAPGQ